MCKYIHSDVQIQGQPLFPVILESTMHEWDPVVFDSSVPPPFSPPPPSSDLATIGPSQVVLKPSVPATTKTTN